jgi:glycosyltransferase involved in cell wall biosynthesis
MKISIIIPSYNAIDKIGRCFKSLSAISVNSPDFEVIFVDDCSTDGTLELIREACLINDNWNYYKLEKNSGSPSQPRNYGISKAVGEYLYFLDCDDEILPDALIFLYKLAVENNACIVRSELIAFDGENYKIMNQIEEWNLQLDNQKKAELIISKQSTVPTTFVKLSLIRDNCIKWNESIRMGEDTLFLVDLLNSSKNIHYLNSPTYIYYKVPSLTPASTQLYGKRELLNHIYVWRTAQESLKLIKVDYFKCRLQIGLSVVLNSLIFKNKGDIDFSSFMEFSEFIKKIRNVVGEFKYSDRYLEILNSFYEADFIAFEKLIKPKLLIAGHDLKFIQDSIADLSHFYEIKIDQWTGHDSHDAVLSHKLLNWADIIWCEWFLGNVKWYSDNKNKQQKLLVRLHRMELGRDFGEKSDVKNIDAIIVVSALYFERVLERFPLLKRHKIRLIDNYVRPNCYEQSKGDDKFFNLAMIGYVPAKKGLKEALIILNKLRLTDSRYNLKLFGKPPEELYWIARDSIEMSYYADCKDYINKNNLSDAVQYVGHLDITSALANNKVGFVLSTSARDVSMPGFESFHLAVADGFAAGACSLILDWAGAEYIWPEQYIFSSTDLISEKILKLSNDEILYDDYAQSGADFLRCNYSVSNFINSIRTLIRELY